MSNCLFCKIINNEIPTFKVYEDEVVLAFLDVNPSAPGHTLVVPKKHVENFFGLTDIEIADYQIRVLKIANKIKNSTLAPTGLNIGVNQWKAAGQLVEHLHTHIIPRWENDGGKDIQSIVNNKTSDDLEIVLDKVKTRK